MTQLSENNLKQMAEKAEHAYLCLPQPADTVFDCYVLRNELIHKPFTVVSIACDVMLVAQNYSEYDQPQHKAEDRANKGGWCAALDPFQIGDKEYISVSVYLGRDLVEHGNIERLSVPRRHLFPDEQSLVALREGRLYGAGLLL